MFRRLLRHRFAFPFLLAGCGACAPSGPAAPDPANPPLAFFEDFASLDPLVWTPGDHRLGLSHLNPANVSVADGLLHLRTPAGSRNGAEISSVVTVGGGTLTARLRCDVPGGALCAFFLYQPGSGDRADEIDMEIVGGRPRNLLMSTWVGGQQTNSAELTLGFDPASGFHDYAIRWNRIEVAFFVDGRRVQGWTRDLPTNPMKIFLNAWWPSWLSGPLPTGDGVFEIDRINGS